MSHLRLQAAMLLLVALPSCSKKQVVVPLPAAPAASSQPQATGQPAPPAPETSAPQPGSATSNATQTAPYQVNKPAPAAAPAARKTTRPAASPQNPQSPATTAPAPTTPAAPVPAPQLVDVVPPDQQRQLNAAIDQSLSRAQASLAGIANRELNKDQQALAEQIRKLMQQAQASRAADLPGAKSLAERAEVLAKDLAGSFH
jgi:ribonuclease E